MADVSMEDKTGEPRTLKDYEDALEAVVTTMKDPPMDRPILVIHLSIIKDGLTLLINLYKEAGKK